MFGSRLQLTKRRDLMKSLLKLRSPRILISEQFETSATDMLAAVRQQQLEGVVGKRKDSFYEPGKRTGSWINSGLAVIALLLLSLLDNFLSLIFNFAKYQPQNPLTSPGPFTLYDKKTQMARYLRIRSIVKTERTGAHERVKAICGLTPEGSHWTLTHEDAVSQVENRTCAFYIERPKDQRYDVIVAMEVALTSTSKRRRTETNLTNFCFSRPVITPCIHPMPYRADISPLQSETKRIESP